MRKRGNALLGKYVPPLAMFHILAMSHILTDCCSLVGWEGLLASIGTSAIKLLKFMSIHL